MVPLRCRKLSQCHQGKTRTPLLAEETVQVYVTSVDTPHVTSAIDAQQRG
jgi:hypothetical protein